MFPWLALSGAGTGRVPAGRSGSPGFVYIALVIDLHTQATAAWEESTATDTASVECCLRMALWGRDNTRRPDFACLQALALATGLEHRFPEPGLGEGQSGIRRSPGHR